MPSKPHRLAVQHMLGSAIIQLCRGFTGSWNVFRNLVRMYRYMRVASPSGRQQQCLHDVQGCMELLRRYSVPISGKRAVVLGRSNIVGMPVAHLLQVSLLEQNSRRSPGSMTSGKVALGRASQFTHFRWQRQTEISAGLPCGHTQGLGHPLCPSVEHIALAGIESEEAAC